MSRHALHQEESVVSIRLYRTEESGGAASASPVVTTSSSLREVYQQAFVPLYLQPKGLDRKTAKLYEDALDKWDTITGGPPIGQIDDWTTASFITELLKQKGRKGPTMAIPTVRKHCTQLNKLLDFCGPRTRDKKSRKNLALLELPPWFDPPEADDDPPDGDFTLEEVQSLYEAAEKMKIPESIDYCPLPTWWRALITVGFYTGLRIGQLMRLEYLDLRPPYIMVWGRMSKKRKGKKQYLAAEALAEIEAIRTPRRRIFQLPHWDENPRWLTACLERLLGLAGIPKHRQFKFHGFRKAHLTLLADGDDHQGVKIAQWSAGHSDEKTTRGHYINGKVQDRLVAAATDRLPSPKPARHRKTVDPRQLPLPLAE